MKTKHAHTHTHTRKPDDETKNNENSTTNTGDNNMCFKSALETEKRKMITLPQIGFWGKLKKKGQSLPNPLVANSSLLILLVANDCLRLGSWEIEKHTLLTKSTCSN